jgi:hypothetical protein
MMPLSQIGKKAPAACRKSAKEPDIPSNLPGSEFTND